MISLRGAVLKRSQKRVVSEKFSVQLLYLDTSTYNNYTGERYTNIAMVQVVNDKVDVNAFSVGDVVDVECYLNGRVFTRKDGSPGFMQQLNIKSIMRATNTAGDGISVPQDQLVQVNLPE